MNDFDMPYKFNADFDIALVKAGWFPERKTLHGDLALHLNSFPSKVKNFIHEFLWITFSHDMHICHPDSSNSYTLKIFRYSFGEITQCLSDVSSPDYLFHEDILESGVDIRVFGRDISEQMDIAIDDHGRIYLLNDISGDIVFLGDSYYRGLYNLFYAKEECYFVYEKGDLWKVCPESRKRIKTNLNLNVDFM